MFSLIPTTTSVSVDSDTGRPREIRTDGQRLAVTALESVRDETSAYSLRTGPRTVFVVHAAGHRFRLVHRLDDRRWTIEDLGTAIVFALDMTRSRWDRDKGIAIFVLHLLTESTRADHASAAAEYRELAKFPGIGSLYYAVPTGDVDEFGQVLDTLAGLRDAGLPVPRTLVTSVAAAVPPFVEDVGEVIVKPTVGGAETRRPVGAFGGRRDIMEQIDAETVRTVPDTVFSLNRVWSALAAEGRVRRSCARTRAISSTTE